MRRKGFTLIELLVVISIIVILAGILYPVFAATKRAAHNVICLSNVKQIGLAVQMYSQDYDEAFPTACAQNDRVVGKAQPRDWPNSVTPYLWDVVMPYVKNPGLWRCPGDIGYTIKSAKIDFRPNTFQLTGSSFAYNTDLAWLATRPDRFDRIGIWAPMTVGALPQPSQIWIAGEPAGHWHNSVQGTTITYHQNMVFADGHAKSLTRDQLNQLPDTRPQ